MVLLIRTAIRKNLENVHRSISDWFILKTNNYTNTVNVFSYYRFVLWNLIEIRMIISFLAL